MNTNTNPNKKDFPPSITAMFATKKNDGNLVSPPLNADGVANLYNLVTKQVVEGSSLFLRKAPRQDKNGNEYYFLDILPPRASLNPTAATKTRPKTESEV